MLNLVASVSLTPLIAPIITAIVTLSVTLLTINYQKRSAEKTNQATLDSQRERLKIEFENELQKKKADFDNDLQKQKNSFLLEEEKSKRDFENELKKKKADFDNDIERKKADFMLEKERKKTELSFDFYQKRLEVINSLLILLYKLRLIVQELQTKDMFKFDFTQYNEILGEIEHYYWNSAPIVNTFGQNFRDLYHHVIKYCRTATTFTWIFEQEEFDTEEDKQLFITEIKPQCEDATDKALVNILAYENHLRELSKQSFQEYL